MKILIISDAWYPQLNGVVRTYEYLKTTLTTMGYEVRVIGPADMPLSMPMMGYAEIRLALFPYTPLRRKIMDFEPDVLHIATEGPMGWAARKYAENYGVEFTSCYHTHFPDYAAARVPALLSFLKPFVRKAGIAFIKKFHDVSSCVFAATQSLEETLKGWNILAPIKRMTRGIDHSVFKIADKTLFHDLKKPVAIYVGRVAVEKNIEEFLDMKWDGSKVIVGDGPDLLHLKAKYKDAHFVGVKKGTDLAAHYQSSDIFVFPSKTDTFGMVLIEALACGIPIAAHDVTGPKDIVVEPFLGALDEDLAVAAQKAVNAPLTREDRACHAGENYSWDKAARQFLETD